MIIKNLLTVLAILVSGILEANVPTTYKNPILSGYHPDPSICRVGDDYYLVNSSFEWFPGVPIYHSKDLVNWKQIGNVLDRASQLNMPADMAHNQGIWAPTIRYHKGKFYMITTAQSCGGNFFVTADKPEGPWSDPVWIPKANGIDPSLFWDDNGDCWYAGAGRMSDASWKNENRIYIAKLDTEKGEFITPKKEVTSGHAANAMYTEGPHIYKIDGRYVMMVAEGGTGFNHAITVMESDNVEGPYLPAMINPVITHRHLGQSHPINTIGHGDLVQTQNGEWWAVMLGKRPLVGHLLARETFMTPVKIENGMPVFNPGVGRVLEEDRRPNLPWTPVESPYKRDEFNGERLGFEYCCVRTPKTQWWQVKDGKLTMQFNKESFFESGNPSFWGRRIENHEFTATTSLLSKSNKANEEAGLLAYRTKESYIGLMKSGQEIILTCTKKGKTPEIIAKKAYKESAVILRFEAKNGKLYCHYGKDEQSLSEIGYGLDLSVLGDNVNGGFNGPFVGIATSSNGVESKNSADFEWFEYLQ